MEKQIFATVFVQYMKTADFVKVFYLSFTIKVH